MGVDHLSLHEELHVTAFAFLQQRLRVFTQSWLRDLRRDTQALSLGRVVRADIELELYRESVVLHPLGVQQLLIAQAEDAHRSRRITRPMHIGTVSSTGRPLIVGSIVDGIARLAPLHILCIPCPDVDAIPNGDARLRVEHDGERPVIPMTYRGCPRVVAKLECLVADFEAHGVDSIVILLLQHAFQPREACDSPDILALGDYLCTTSAVSTSCSHHRLRAVSTTCQPTTVIAGMPCAEDPVLVKQPSKLSCTLIICLLL
mmetsp:Transcript_37264/g.87456  ORF Transcript_37264/g.87456 Transcript_37264/m.87456 type:complete len:260 (-) Transcript_37264:224-1003(-)